jgi:hypothetical protein
MEHIFELVIAVVGGGLVAGFVAGFSAFYAFNGRLSKVEGKLELLLDTLGKNHPYKNIDGIPVPIPTKEKPIGGTNAIIDTLEEIPDEVRREELFTVFELVTDGDALIHLVRHGYIAINDIRLITDATGDAHYAAIISMENLTDRDIEYVIPKGQVFENKEPGSGRQNLAAARGEKLTLKARTSYDMRVNAHCINKHLSGPDGSPGNLTIFKIRNDNFRGQNDLWQSVNKSVEKAKLVVEGRRKKS